MASAILYLAMPFVWLFQWYAIDFMLIGLLEGYDGGRLMLGLVVSIFTTCGIISSIEEDIEHG